MIGLPRKVMPTTVLDRGRPGESRSRDLPKRPSRNQSPPTASQQAPSPQYIAFDDGLEPAIRIAPLGCDDIGAVYDARDLPPAGTGAFAVDGNDGVSEMDSIGCTWPIGCDGQASAQNDMRQGGETIQVAINLRKASETERQAHAAHGDEVSLNDQGDIGRARLDGDKLVAVRAEMHVNCRRHLFQIEIAEAFVGMPFGVCNEDVVG
jgi:hypothetical protein